VPTAAYVQSALFLVLMAIALFASAGTLAVAGFWLYLAIQLAAVVASFVLLSPDLIRERMRPGGQSPPLGLRLAIIVLFGALWSPASTAAVCTGATMFRRGCKR